MEIIVVAPGASLYPSCNRQDDVTPSTKIVSKKVATKLVFPQIEDLETSNRKKTITGYDVRSSLPEGGVIR